MLLKQCQRTCRALLERRLVFTLLLGFSSGLPFSLVGATLSAWYTVAGISLMTIGALSLVQLPYLLKPLWAPFLDRFVPLSMGRRRSWILISQVCLALGLLAMAFLAPARNPRLLAYMALMVCFFSASQDIAYDAYRTDLLEPHERGIGSAMVSVAYRVALLVSGAFALVMASVWGWHWTYVVMAAVMFLQVLVTWASPPLKRDQPPQTMIKAVVLPFRLFLRRRYAWLILLFIVIYKLTDAFALSLSTTFLLRGVGFSLVTIGSVMKVVAMVASLLGALVGGVWMMRISMLRALVYFACLQALSNVGYLLLALLGKSFALMVGAIFIEYFCGGLASVAFVAYLMSLCHRRCTATQYALFSSLASVGRVLIGPLAAWVARQWGWVDYFAISILLGIPPLLLLWWMHGRLRLFDHADPMPSPLSID